MDHGLYDKNLIDPNWGYPKKSWFAQRDSKPRPQVRKPVFKIHVDL